MNEGVVDSAERRAGIEGDVFDPRLPE